MEEYEEAIAKKELAIDILKEYKTTTAIEWFKDKGVNDFVSLDVSEEYGSLCFKYLNNKYKINSYEDRLSISCNGKTVLRVLLVEKIVDDKTYYEFDWSDDNNIQELRLYDWVEEFPIIVNKEIEELKTKKTKSEIEFEKEQELVKSRIVSWINQTVSLGKFAEPESNDYKNYEENQSLETKLTKMVNSDDFFSS